MAVDILGGIDCISLYLYDMEGWSDRNTELARATGARVRASPRLWAVGLDGNMEPSSFAEHPDIAATGGVVLATTAGTCRYREIWKTYDYFLVHPALKSLVVGIEVINDWPTYPHKPVRLTLRGDAAKLWKRVARVPRPLPVATPIGCRREPQSWPPSEAIWNPRIPEQEQTHSLADAYALVLAGIENEVLDRCDIVEPQARSKYIGRGRELGYAVVPLIPPRRTRDTSPWYAQHIIGARLELDELCRVMVALVEAKRDVGVRTIKLWEQHAAFTRRLERRQRWLRKRAQGSTT